MHSPIPFSLRPSELLIPYYEGNVRAGQSRFVSAAQDYEMKELDLNELLIKDPPATFMVKVDKNSDSMIDAGIMPNSKLIVNRAMASRAPSKSIVVAIVDGEFVVKLLHKNSNGTRLLSLNHAKGYPPIEFSGDQELVIWGVVEHAITSYHR
jgi:DNA polymerase V